MEKPNHPDDVRPWTGRYSLMTDLKLNFWIVVAGAMLVFSNELLRGHPDWDGWVRGLLTLSPLLAVGLLVRSYLRFIRGMDELQRRVQLEAWLIATLAALFLVTGINMLNASGMALVAALFPHGLELPGALLATLLLWIAARMAINRRYL